MEDAVLPLVSTKQSDLNLFRQLPDRADYLFESTSFNIALSSDKSATRFFNWALSFSCPLSFLACAISNPLYFLNQR